MKKTFQIIRTCFYVLAGILVFIFNKQLMMDEGSLINFIVGVVMLGYSLDIFINLLISKKIKDEKIKVLNALINFVLGILMIALLEGNAHELVVACVVWSVWSIMRESEEIFEKVIEEFKETPCVSIINLIESIIVIFFSVELILEPGEHHAHTHLILLGFELILEVMWVHLANLEKVIRNKLFRKEVK